MSYQIEQTREQTSETFALMSRVDLEHVRLIESTARCRLRPTGESLDLVFDIDFSPESASKEGNEIIVLTRFNFVVREVQAEATAKKIEVVVLFEATYRLTVSEYVPTTAQIEAFRRGNAIFNCWPFFREYVQSVFVRMGCPPPSIPFLRLVPKRDEESGRLQSKETEPMPSTTPRRLPAKRKG